MAASVSYQVPGLSQPNSNLCWWTCFKMLTLYHRNQGVTVNQLQNIETHANAMAIYTQNDSTSTEEIEEIATDLGLSVMAATLTGERLLNLMEQNGPVMYCGYWPGGNGGHCIVLTGTDGQYVSANDPWYGAQASRYRRLASQILIQDTALVYYEQ
jgi:ABC-type bacteriocin/lantibiotic exporter with double-glycine peptidase domain